MSSTTAGFAKVREADAQEAVSIDYSPMVAELRSTFMGGKTKDINWRKQQLKQVQLMIKENYEEITAAFHRDHSGPKLRGFMELGTYSYADEALANLDRWAAEETVKTPFIVSPTRMGKSVIRKEPKGIVLIIGPWNFPFELVFHPLVSAIAAGNAVVIKPSEVAKNSALCVESLVNKYLDTTCIKVVQGAVPETSALLACQWDHIFYTGNGAIAKIVLRAAAEHLTPVTLELGGKSPVIIDKSAKMASVISRVFAAKWLNAGQICVAPDYVLVHKDREREFLDGLKKAVEDAYGKDPKQSKDYGRIINANHVNRIKGLLEKTNGEVIMGGIETVDPDKHYFPPTIVKGPQLGEPLLTEEIFGPVLPVLAVDSMEDAVHKVNTICDKPLALYVYSEEKAATRFVLDNTNSGGGCINTSLEHITNSHLPFGGVGGSGYGSYHGKAGFDEFTHKRSILQQDTLLKKDSFLPPPPYKDDSMYNFLIKAQITGFLSDGQKLFMKSSFAAGAVAVAAMLLNGFEVL